MTPKQKPDEGSIEIVKGLRVVGCDLVECLDEECELLGGR